MVVRIAACRIIFSGAHWTRARRHATGKAMLGFVEKHGLSTGTGLEEHLA